MNLKKMYQQYIETGLLQHLPMYNLSQDPLESLFSRVRSFNGDNDNPLVHQFVSAFRKILLFNEISSSKTANCVDQLKLFNVSSKRQHQSQQNEWQQINIQFESNEEEVESFLTMQPNENDFLINCYEEATIASVASSIEQKILRSGRFECDCVNVLERNEKVTGLDVQSNYVPPCISTMYACKVANICFNFFKNQISFNYNMLIDKIMRTIDFDCVFLQNFDCDITHKRGFIQYIVEEYIRIHANYIAKNMTLVEQKILCRKYLKKLIHFHGE